MPAKKTAKKPLTGRVGPQWDSADYYSLSDQDEYLQFSDVGELLEDYADQNGDEADWPVTVYAWARMEKPTSKEVLAMANDLVESTESWWFDQWGDLDTCRAKGIEALRSEFHRALQEWVECQTVWACEVVARREFSKAYMIDSTQTSATKMLKVSKND